MTLLVLTATALAFVCPPVEEGAVLRQAGEFCGGTCDTIGRCAAGLKCEVKESPASKFSFAIVWGAKKQGVCVTDPELAMSLVETSPEQHDTPLLGSDPATYSPPKGRALVGGEKPIAVDSDEVTAAAKFGVTNIVAESNSMTPPALKQIVSATSQVRIFARAPFPVHLHICPVLSPLRPH